MNVLLVVDRWLPGQGGRERYAAALAEFLVRSGDRVRVVTMERAPGPEVRGLEYLVAENRPRMRLRRERSVRA